MPPKNPYKDVFDDLEDGTLDGKVFGRKIPGYWDDIVPDDEADLPDEEPEEEEELDNGIEFVTR